MPETRTRERQRWRRRRAMTPKPSRPEAISRALEGSGTTPTVKPLQLSALSTVKLSEVNVPVNCNTPLNSVPMSEFPDTLCVPLPDQAHVVVLCDATRNGSEKV